MANRLVGNADTRVKTELLNVRRVRLVGQRVEDGPGHKPHYRVKRSIDRPHPHFCTDSISLAVSAHVAQTYGGMQTRSQKRKGGLAPWQERRATEMLAADLAGATPLTEIAGACGL